MNTQTSKTAELILGMRTEFGESRDVFAKRIGLTGAAIKNYEQGRQPKPFVLKLLSDLAKEMGWPESANWLRNLMQDSIRKIPTGRRPDLA